MNRPPLDITRQYRKAQGQVLLFGHAMIVLMMALLAASFALFGERLFAEWQGLYLVVLAVILAVEAIFTRGQTRDMDFRERLVFHASEWVAFAVIAKIILYVVHGPSRLLEDLPRWQADFFTNFFTGDYLYVLVVMTIVWMLSRSYTAEFEALYDRENDAEWEDLGKLQNALYDIRRRISTRLFLVGILVVILAVLARTDLREVLQEVPTGLAFTAPIILLVAYFLVTLVLLSHTQFSLLRTRWLWQRLAISPRLAVNWLRYGLIAFAVLSAVVLLLPTGYSIGLLDMLRMLLDFGMQAFSLLFFIVSLPFTICVSLLSMLNSGEPQQQNSPPIGPPGLLPIEPSAEPFAWLEFLKSLAFWVIFLAVIFFALRHYFGQNTALWNAIKRFPLFRWMRGAWQGLWSWLRGANRQIAGFVQDTLHRMRAQRAATASQVLRRAFNLGRMTPRERIIHFYLSLVHLGGERGVDREPSQTPYAYERRLRSAVPEIDSDLHTLTGSFLEARYSDHSLADDQSDQAATLWERIKAVLQHWKREE